jgi:hypothetical protein
MKKSQLGWREWVGVAAWNLPAIKAKIDTGARTSSLHALDPEVFSEKGAQYVRFLLMPVQRSLTLGLQVDAPLIDRRTVTNSGGTKQERLVVGVRITLGSIERDIEVTLANRRDMKFRMLLGRQALEGFSIDPAASYLLGKSEDQRDFLRRVRRELINP